MRRALRWLIPLSAIPVLALLAYGFRLDPRDIPSPLVGRAAAPFTLAGFDGAPVSLEAHRGQVVVVERGEAIRALPAQRVRLALYGVGPSGQRTIGEYTLFHAPWPGRRP